MFERSNASTPISTAETPLSQRDLVLIEEPMKNFEEVRLPVGKPIYKPQIETVFRRIAQASQRLMYRAIEGSRQETLKLSSAAIEMCACDAGTQTVIDYYRQLEWSVLDRVRSTQHLMSESTFRRHVRRRREERWKLVQTAVRIEHDFR